MRKGTHVLHADKLLFTPGPLTTSKTVKHAMMKDYGSRDMGFIKIIQEIRSELLHIADLTKEEGYETVLIQGSGTFGVESVISSAIGESDILLVIINGVYGERILKMAKVHRIDVTAVTFAENEWPDVAEVEAELKKGSYTHIAMIHSETTTGIINPLEPFGHLAKKYGCTFIVDAMSSFGGVPIDFKKCNIDFLISSSNKCIEGVPGFSFVICRKDDILACAGQARTLSLDLYAQWYGLENDGQFRFTPPTHALVAFHEALIELKEEGGIKARAFRYRKNHDFIKIGMFDMGFRPYLPEARQGYIISTYLYPDSPNFDFKTFYEKLNAKGFVIYPGKLTKADCFRIGNIGHLFSGDMIELLMAVADVKKEMRF